MGPRSCYAVRVVHRETSARVSANEFDGLAPSTGARDSSVSYRVCTTGCYVGDDAVVVLSLFPEHPRRSIKSPPWRIERRWLAHRRMYQAGKEGQVAKTVGASKISLLSVNVTRLLFLRGFVASNTGPGISGTRNLWNHGI